MTSDFISTAILLRTLSLLCRYRGDLHELRLRKSNESLEVYDSEISGNREQAVLLMSPLREISSYNISEVTVIINRTSITDNGAGIEQVSRSESLLYRSGRGIKLPQFIALD